LKSLKYGPNCGGDWLISDFQMVEVHLPSFGIFTRGGGGVLVMFLFSNKGAKIKEIEILYGVIKQRS
jgi:hypothetical protein